MSGLNLRLCGLLLGFEAMIKSNTDNSSSAVIERLCVFLNTGKELLFEGLLMCNL